MSEENGKIKVESEVQYVYDDEEFVFDPSLGESVDENGLNDYYFADGTRAIFVNGQYFVPADTQAIVLQEGQEDLNSYIINQDCDSVVLNEDQDTNEQSLDAPEYVQYVEGSENEEQQIIYYTSADGTINFDEYESAEALIDQDQERFEGLQEIQEDSAFSYTEIKPIGMQEIVDLEELVRQQNGENEIVLERMPTEDVRQYRYAVLRDGKLHIQSTPIEQQIEDLEKNNFAVSHPQTVSGKESQIVDLSQITGKNLITGQTVTLHDYMTKLQKKLDKDSQESPDSASFLPKMKEIQNHGTNQSVLVTNSANRTIFANNLTINKTVIANKVLPVQYQMEQPRTMKNVVEKERKVRALKSLLNTTIPIGKTTNGKRIVGKIVRVEAKTQEETSTQNVGDAADYGNNHQFENTEEQYHNLSELMDISTVESMGITQESNASCPQLQEVVEMIDENNIHAEELRALTQTDDTSSLSDDILQRIQLASQEQEQINQKAMLGIIDLTNQDEIQPTQHQKLAMQRINAITRKIGLDVEKVSTGTQDVIRTNPAFDQEENKVKIIVKSHKISKECYDDICKTLSGLMEMATVQKKLTERNLAVKVIEKRYSSKEGKMVKSAFHIYGYMAMEFQLGSPEEIQFGSAKKIIQKWKFIPDKNTQDALLTDEIVQQRDEQNEAKTSKYVETVVVTLLMTYDKCGKRSIKVILNPSTGNKCSICTKEFKSYSQAQLHMTKVHNIDGSQTRCHLCQAQFEEVTKLEKHKEMHVVDGKLIRCTFCKETFMTSARLYRHMAQHVPSIKPLQCTLCNQRCANDRSLKKHLLLHTGIKLYKCNLCDKRYTTQNDLTEHQKVHNPMKLFTCDVCNRKFTRLSNLVRHNEIHKKSGNSLFSCEICGASYCFSSSLTRHMVQNHINANDS